MSTPFKVCPSCKEVWETRDQFLADAELDLIGYQVHFKALELGLFLFNHSTNNTTLAVQAGSFASLYQGRVFQERKTRTKECPEHCLHPADLLPCDAPCECAYVREVLQIVKGWDRTAPNSAN